MSFRLSGAQVGGRKVRLSHCHRACFELFGCPLTLAVLHLSREEKARRWISGLENSTDTKQYISRTTNTQSSRYLMLIQGCVPSATDVVVFPDEKARRPANSMLMIMLMYSCEWKLSGMPLLLAARRSQCDQSVQLFRTPFVLICPAEMPNDARIRHRINPKEPCHTIIITTRKVTFSSLSPCSLGRSHLKPRCSRVTSEQWLIYCRSLPRRAVYSVTRY